MKSERGPHRRAPGQVAFEVLLGDLLERCVRSFGLGNSRLDKRGQKCRQDCQDEKFSHATYVTRERGSEKPQLCHWSAAFTRLRRFLAVRRAIREFTHTPTFMCEAASRPRSRSDRSTCANGSWQRPARLLISPALNGTEIYR